MTMGTILKRYRLILCCALLFMSGAGSASAQHYIGVMGGWGGGSARFKPAKETGYEWGLYSGGLSYKFYSDTKYVGAIEIDLMFTQKGFNYDLAFESDESYHRRINAIELPLIWQPHFYLFQRHARFFINLGIQVSYNLSSTYSRVSKTTGILESGKYAMQLNRDNRFGYGLCGGPVEFVDIGGGLGVDYDGTRSSYSESSVNYSIQEYVNDSISIMVDASNKNNIPHPNIITESGRSLTAHHSVLIFEVLETASLPEMEEEFEVSPEDHELVQELYQIWDNLNQSRMLEAWHDAQQIREETLDLFSHGIVDLKTRAQIERLYWSVCREINHIVSGLKHAPDEFRNLDKLLADKYFCNFSLFQSLPDSWAIDQIFPIMPIQRLDEKPDRSATLQDITCDSDGKIANFISTKNVSHYMPLHSLKSKEPYYLGVFLVGAYQEILGDMHNLFGDTNAVHVSVNEKGYSIEQIIDGETVAEVLDYVQYSPKKLVRTLETWVTKSVKEGKISVEEGKEFLSNYRSGLYGYTYLE